MITVVPWARKLTSEGSTLPLARTFKTPFSKSGGVVSDFAVTTECLPVSESVSKQTKSVKVPPTSVATRILDFFIVNLLYFFK